MTNVDKKFKVIICDLSDVLIKGLEGVEFSISQSVHLPVETVREKLFSYNYHPLWIGSISEDLFLGNMIQEFHWEISVNTLKNLIRQNFVELRGVRKIYEKLSASYKLALLSTNVKEWVDYLNRNFAFAHMFESGTYYSFDIGYTKREPEAYTLVLEKLGILCNEALLIDDSQRHIDIAKNLGIKGIRFSNQKQLTESLAEHEIYI